MKKQFIITLFIMSTTSILITSGYAGWKPSVEDEPVKSKMLLNTQTEEIIKNFKIHYPHLTVYFEKAYGYAVFPTITKGGIGIGAAHGTGEVYDKGECIGTASMTQVTIGASLADKHTVKLYFSKTKKLSKSGLMFEATVGGQKFNFKPKQ